MFLLNLKFSCLVGNYNLLIDYTDFIDLLVLCVMYRVHRLKTRSILLQRHPAMFNLGEDSISFLVVMDS